MRIVGKLHGHTLLVLIHGQQTGAGPGENMKVREVQGECLVWSSNVSMILLCWIVVCGGQTPNESSLCGGELLLSLTNCSDTDCQVMLRMRC